MQLASSASLRVLSTPRRKRVVYFYNNCLFSRFRRGAEHHEAEVSSWKWAIKMKRKISLCKLLRRLGNFAAHWIIFSATNKWISQTSTILPLKIPSKEKRMIDHIFPMHHSGQSDILAAHGKIRIGSIELKMKQKHSNWNREFVHARKRGHKSHVVCQPIFLIFSPKPKSLSIRLWH